MEFTTPLIKGRLIKRYKRFLADVELDNGEIVTAHCANTGAMTGCAEPGFTVYLSHANNPKRKLQYTWELAQNTAGEWIGINTSRANKLVEESLHDRALYAFSDYNNIRREFKPVGATSRFDFLLEQTDSTGTVNKQCLLEVKSVTLCDDGVGYFPDAVTTRGTKHCRELAEQLDVYQRCALVFCVQHSGIRQVDVARHIDSQYADTLLSAMQRGLEVFAYRCNISDKKILINQSLDVVF